MRHPDQDEAIPEVEVRDARPECSAQSGAKLLDEVHGFLGRFLAYPSAHAHVAHTLWIAHCT